VRFVITLKGFGGAINANIEYVDATQHTSGE
jgi:hypothetical protein